MNRPTSRPKRRYIYQRRTWSRKWRTKDASGYCHKLMSHHIRMWVTYLFIHQLRFEVTIKCLVLYWAVFEKTNREINNVDYDLYQGLLIPRLQQVALKWRPVLLRLDNKTKTEQLHFALIQRQVIEANPESIHSPHSYNIRKSWYHYASFAECNCANCRKHPFASFSSLWPSSYVPVVATFAILRGN